MQHRVNLYFNDENPIDAKIWAVLEDKKRRPDVIKAMLLGVIDLNNIEKANKKKENDIDVNEVENMEGIDLE